MITQEVIERFFSNQSTSQEAAEVNAYFEANPDALKSLEQEWNEFQATTNIAPGITNKLWQQIQNETAPAPVFSLYLKRFAIAASVVFMLGAAWYFLIYKTGNPRNDFVQVANNFETVTNTTSNKMTVWFSDSSKAELMPNSAVSFYENFDSLSRKVTLQGEASFAVTKNSRRPFSVTSGSIITTVLGTKFTVKSFSTDKQISVTLHEGKVMITPNGVVFSGNKNVYYLVPGDVFVYTKQTNEAYLQNNSSVNNIPKKSGNADNSKGSSVMSSDNWYMFNNQPLAEVLEQLELLYNTKIEYKKADLKGLTFIGKLDKTDSLETILSSIANLNNLRVTKNGNAWVLGK